MGRREKEEKGELREKGTEDMKDMIKGKDERGEGKKRNKKID